MHVALDYRYRYVSVNYTTLLKNVFHILQPTWKNYLYRTTYIFFYDGISNINIIKFNILSHATSKNKWHFIPNKLISERGKLTYEFLFGILFNAPFDRNMMQERQKKAGIEANVGVKHRRCTEIEQSINFSIVIIHHWLCDYDSRFQQER